MKTVADLLDGEVKELNRGGEAASADIRVLFVIAVFVTSTSKIYDLLMKAMRAACVDERRNKDAALPPQISAGRAVHLEKTGAAIAAEFLASRGAHAATLARVFDDQGRESNENRNKLDENGADQCTPDAPGITLRLDTGWPRTLSAVCATCLPSGQCPVARTQE